MALLVSYASDSDSESGEAPPADPHVPPPAPTSSSSSGLSLPPPSTAPRRVPPPLALPAFPGEHPSPEPSSAPEDERASKRPRLQLGPGAGATLKHSLLSALPPPKNPHPKVHKLQGPLDRADESRLKEIEDEMPPPGVITSSRTLSSPPVDPDRPRGKDNAAFRAMLGLKAPSSASPPAHAKSMAGGIALPPPTKAYTRTSASLESSQYSTRSTASTSPSPAPFSSDAPSPARVRYASRPRSAAPSPSPSLVASIHPYGRGALSSAPAVEGVDESQEALDAQAEADELAAQVAQYHAMGWKPNPDGTWYPATPEAMAQAQSQAQATAQAEPVDGKTRRADVNLPDLSQMISVDAREVAASAPDNPISLRRSGLGGAVALAVGKKRGHISALVGIAKEKKEEEQQALSQHNHSSHVGRH